MKYTNFCNEKISCLGFGGMRLPTDEAGKIDYARAEVMVDKAMSNGVNYYDTAFMYHDGESEVFYGNTLTKYPRESYFLADKMPSGYPKPVEEIFETQLKRGKAEYFDFYLLHSITNDNFDSYFEKNNVVDFALGKKAEGRIRHLGFSFHGDAALLRRVLNKYDCFEFVQLQLNYYDIFKNDAGELYDIVRSHGLPVIIMEPVRGGLLAKLSDSAAEVFTSYDPTASLASWAIRYAMSLDGVMTVLSGMSDLEQVTDNLSSADMPKLNDEQIGVIKKAYEAFCNEVFLPCTACRYCSDCPQSIDIADIFKRYNRYGIEGDWGRSRMREDYAKLEHTAADCVECGHCVTRCPQGLKIPELLKSVQAALGGK